MPRPSDGHLGQAERVAQPTRPFFYPLTLHICGAAVSALMTPYAFADKWRSVRQKESSVSREHFIDLCRMLEQPTPAEADPHGTTYAFKRKVTKTTGGKGYADVWKRGHFAWEYKGKRANSAVSPLDFLPKGDPGTAN